MGLQTEKLHSGAAGLDQFSDVEILTVMYDAQIEAAKTISAAIPAIEAGAQAMTDAIKSGGNIVYAAAGSSGLACLGDGLEIPPTFGVEASRIHILRAGGFDNMTVPKEGAEDDADEAREAARVIGPSDCVICMAASGNTIYPNIIMNIARDLGATTVGIANNPGTKLLEGSDIPILLSTPPEVIAGSTRLGAGTAQKIALNMMSSLMGVKLGHVMDGLMVNVTPTNNKLKKRAAGIVMQITGCDAETAHQNLQRTDWGVKAAILITSGAKDSDEATKFLAMADQNLRSAITTITSG
ncbi:MAG: N-acetylmuramic acid 6-phosphate etherase [Paracoccaceae bacterium]